MLHPTQTPCNVLLTIQTHRSVTSYKKHIQLIASYNKSVINFRKQSSFTTLAKMARVVSEMTVLYVADMDTRRSKYQLNITLAFRDLTQLDNRLGIWPVKNLASASPNGSSWAIYDRPGQTWCNLQIKQASKAIAERRLSMAIVILVYTAARCLN